MNGLVVQPPAPDIEAPTGTDIIVDSSLPAINIDLKGKKINPTEVWIDAKDTHLNRIDVSLWKEGVEDWIKFPGEWISPVGTDFNKNYAVADKLGIASLTDGKYEVRATASDKAGNSKNAESKFFTIDKTAPAVPTATFTATPSDKLIANNQYTNEEYFRFDLSSDSDVARYQLRYSKNIQGIERLIWSPSDLNGYQKGMGVNTYIDLFTKGEGKHSFSFSACDEAGNCSKFSDPFVVIYDKTPPVVQIEFTGNNANDSEIGGIRSWKDARKVTGTITDNNHGETKLFRVNSGGDDTEIMDRLAISDTSDPTVKTFKVNDDLTEGTYYIIHTDRAGLTSKSARFVVSNKKPLIDNVKNIISGDDSEIIDKDSNIFIGNNTSKVAFDVGNGENANAKVDAVTVSGWIYDESEEDKRGGMAFADAEITKDPATGSYEVDLKEYLGTKNNWVDGRKIVVMLQARNQANVLYQYVFTANVDTAAPNLTISVDQTDGANTTRKISGTTDDKTSPVIVKLGSEERTIQPEDFVDNDNGTFGWSTTFIGLSVASNYQAVASSQDRLGNQSVERSVNFEVEAVPVVTTPVDQLSTSQNSSTVTIRTTQVISPLANLGLAPADGSDVLADEDNTTNKPVEDLKIAENNGGVLDADDNRADADGQARQKTDWSLTNLVMAIVAGIIGVVALSGLGKKEGRVSRILAIAVAVGAISAFLIREDMSQSMGLINLWTIAYVAVPIVQTTLLSLKKGVKEK